MLKEWHDEWLRRWKPFYSATMEYPEHFSPPDMRDLKKQLNKWLLACIGVMPRVDWKSRAPEQLIRLTIWGMQKKQAIDDAGRSLRDEIHDLEERLNVAKRADGKEAGAEGDKKAKADEHQPGRPKKTELDDLSKRLGELVDHEGKEKEGKKKDWVKLSGILRGERYHEMDGYDETSLKPDSLKKRWKRNENMYRKNVKYGGT